ncbi:TRAP transporter small permease [Vannielia litorea]|uniref:TRAP transporter small permease protein n=1 Tax=Vannielia litorea TaxID=1217970 RepID=A0A1N6GUK2_9RHOB|nr:TRAP transporter small permease [Vannielia litorea]SIO11209.1 Tripartite ATP-independent transporter, DctQ component [Vannielia litorea]
MSAAKPAKATAPWGRWFGTIANGFAVLGGVALFALMFITVVAVFWRYALRDPIFGIGDMSSLSLVVIVAAGVTYGAVHGAHISVDILSAVAGRRTKRLTDLLVRALSVAICGFAAWALAVKGACGLPCGAVTPNLGIVHTPFYYLLSAALAVMTALLLYQLLTGLRHWSGQDPNEDNG